MARAAGRHPGVPAGRARDSRDRGACPPCAGAPPVCGCRRDPSAVFEALGAGAATDLRALARPAHGARHERRRDLAHGARDPIRHRHRPRAGQALQRPQQDHAAPDREDLPGGGAAARRAKRTRPGRRLRAPVLAGRLRGSARLHGTRDPAELARVRDPANGRAGAWGRRRVSLRRCADPARDRRRVPAAGRDRGRRRGARADPGRSRARATAARSPRRPHRPRRARRRLPPGGADHRERARGPGSARTSARQAIGRGPGAPALPRRALGLPLAGRAVGVLRRPHVAEALPSQARRGVSRAVRQLPPDERVARRAPPARERTDGVRMEVGSRVACHLRRRPLCAPAQGAARGPRGERRR